MIPKWPKCFRGLSLSYKRQSEIWPIGCRFTPDHCKYAFYLISQHLTPEAGQPQIPAIGVQSKDILIFKRQTDIWYPMYDLNCWKAKKVNAATLLTTTKISKITVYLQSKQNLTGKKKRKEKNMSNCFKLVWPFCKEHLSSLTCVLPKNVWVLS